MRHSLWLLPIVGSLSINVQIQIVLLLSPELLRFFSHVPGGARARAGSDTDSDDLGTVENIRIASRIKRRAIRSRISSSSSDSTEGPDPEGK